jgi:hypothetical protein
MRLVPVQPCVETTGLTENQVYFDLRQVLSLRKFKINQLSNRA